MDREQIIKEMKETIREAGLKLVDLFDSDEIVNSEPAKKAKQVEYEHAKRVEKVLGEEREKVITLTRQVEEKDTKIGSLNEIVSKTQVRSLFDSSKQSRKLDDKEATFIEKRLAGFKSSKEGEELKVEFEKFIDAQVNDYIDTAKLLGVEIKKEGEKKEEKGAGNQDGKGGEADFTKPENNDLIPE